MNVFRHRGSAMTGGKLASAAPAAEVRPAAADSAARGMRFAASQEPSYGQGLT
ncbi:hypothetical protein PJI17_13150 [Mycobacterium kansasii]